MNANPGRDAALYIEFTAWDSTPSGESPDIVGTAAGKVGVGSSMFAGRDICWLTGTFRAVIKAP